MRLKNIYRIVVAAAIPLWGLGALSGCADAWDDHYEKSGDNPTATLLECVEAQPQLSDFLALLKATHIYNNNHATRVTFADLLGSDQSLTVWAPVNGSFDADSLLELCQTAKGDSTVGQHFVMNHIAHNLYNMNVQTAQDVLMLNNKFLPLGATSLYNALTMAEKRNIFAKNGLLHVLENDVQYTYNVYEALTSLPEFAHFGRFLSHYEKQELDENRSVQAGLVDGQKVYSDSVMVKKNALFNVFDQIMSEDSTFLMLAPDATIWKTVYDEAAQYFNFGSMPKADSICEYWTTVSLMGDLIYNRNIQHVQDSLFSTSYRTRNWPYHVFQNPLAEGGLLSPANFKDSLQCSNGYIYRLKQWPFTPEDLYFHRIITQAEDGNPNYENKKTSLDYREAKGDSVSGNRYAVITPVKSNDNWTITYDIANTLSGTYDICAVILPKTVYRSNSRDFKPNKFKATLNYVDADGVKQQKVFAEEKTNDGHKIDTVLIGRFTFPTCNYQQPEITTSLMIECSIDGRKAQERNNYSFEMFLDCIYFKPVSAADAAGIKSRKEARK